MDTPVLIVVAAVVLVIVAGLLVALLRSRAESRRALLVAQQDTAELHARLDVLSDQLERQSTTMVRTDDPAYVITDAGAPEPQIRVPDRLVLSATVGEPLVKALAFGHGVRRALSAESRNRIWFEMRREVRRARKQRRRETKEAWRRMQAEERSAPDSPRPASAA
jgi:hypothetical protein